MSEDLLAMITESIVRGDLESAVTLTRKGLESDLPPLEIINQGLVTGMNIAGEKFAQGEYFLPHLLMAAKGMQVAMELLEPELNARKQVHDVVGTVVIGTVHGDIHEIGKSLVGTMLSANGFKVFDLGVDVPSEDFVAKVRETGAEMLALSALLTTTMIGQREVIENLIQAGIRDQVKVIVGGAPVSQAWADEISADAYAENAMDAVEVAKRLLQ